MQAWKRLGSAPVLQHRWLNVTADRCELPSGLVLDPYFVVHEPDWVHVFAQDAQARVLVVRQHRYPAGLTSTELPGGVVDPGETALAAAQRELLEETGHRAAHWADAGALFANPARQTNRLHLFVASGLQRVAAQSLDASEDIEVDFLSLAALHQAIDGGQVCQALHVASLYQALRFLQRRHPPAWHPPACHPPEALTMADLDPVFADLRAILAPFAARLDAKKDNPTELYLDTRHLQKNKKPLFFAAVQRRPSHVSFHLMPVYLQPALLAGLSPALKARMQGQSCFNFKALDPALRDELAALTQAGFASYLQQGWV